MPQQKPNQFARVAAVVALAAAFLVVIVTLASSGGDSNDGEESSGDAIEASGPTAKGERALEAGVWIVGEGDNLTTIAEQTGIDRDLLEELNPEIDPQRLLPGQRISLRSSSAGQDSSSQETGTEVDAGDTPSSGTGEGDGGPSGTTTNPSIGVD